MSSPQFPWAALNNFPSRHNTHQLPLNQESRFMSQYENINMDIQNTGFASVVYNQKGMKIVINDLDIDAEDIQVFSVGDTLMIKGKYQSEDCFGFVSKQFTVEYKIPDTIDKSKMSISFNSRGFLVVEGPNFAGPSSPGFTDMHGSNEDIPQESSLTPDMY